MKKQLLSLLMILLPLAANADAIEIDGIYYNLIANGNVAEVTSNPNQYSGNVVIPEKVTYESVEYSVTSIGERAFYRCSSLTSIAIPNSVTSIGDYAFNDCSGLQKVIVPDIAAWCRISFYNSNNPLVYAHHLYSDENTEITNLVIPNSVTSIVDWAFFGCSGLTSITISNSVTIIGEGAFYGCSGLTSITIPNSVTSIEKAAFSDCSGLTSVTIPNSVTIIGEGAFFGCSGLTSITIPNSVTNIGDSTFRLCSALTSISIPNSVTTIEDGAFYYCSSLTSVTIPNSVTRIGTSVFEGCRGLTSVTIPNSVTSIGDRAFSGCRGLTSVNIPNSVTTIEDCAFYDCSGLTSVIIPNSVTTIRNYAFYNCSGLTSVIIPNSVTRIGDSVFEGCRGLTSVIIGSGVTQIGQNAFDGPDIPVVVSLIEKPFTIIGKKWSNRTFTLNTFNNATLYVPAGTIKKYKAKDGWKDFLFIKEKDQGEEPDDDGEESADSKITIHIATAGTLSDIIPDNEKYQIEELTLTGEINSDDLGFLREMAGKERRNEGTKMSFKDTEGKLVSLDISKAKIVVGGISIEADDMDNFFEFAVTRDNEIPPRIFEDCKNLTNISISDDVYSIGSRAFHGTKWYDNQPDGLVYIGNMLYSYKGDMPSNTDVTIKDGTIGIACSAFISCKNLVSVKIPNSIINIGGFNKYPNVDFDGAFKWCTGLKSIISEIQNPPVFEYSTFDSIDDTIYSNATLYVPTGTIDVYKSTEGWNNFTNIVDSDPSGINNVELNEKKDAPAYNLNGRRLHQPQKGINIIDGKKVLIK